MYNLAQKNNKYRPLVRKAKNRHQEQAVDIWATIFTDLIDEKHTESMKKVTNVSPLP